MNISLQIDLGPVDALDDARLQAVLDGIAGLRTRLTVATWPTPGAEPAAPEPTPRAAPPVEAPNPERIAARQRGAGHTIHVTHDELDALGPRLDWLTAQERATIRARADGKTYREIAPLIQSSEKAAAQAFHRALRKLKADTKPRIRGRRKTVHPLTAANDGRVYCPLCNLNRTALHVEQHQAENEAERRRIEAGRASIASLAPVDGKGPGTL